MNDEKMREEVERDIDEFIAQHGRPPSTLEILQWREARASVSLDKGDVGTYSLDDEENETVTGAGVAYTAVGPRHKNQEVGPGRWLTQAELDRIEERMEMLLGQIAKAWYEGRQAPDDASNPYEVDDDDEAALDE